MKKHDKLLHFAIGAGIAFWCGCVPYLDNKVLFDGIWAALFSGLIAGIAKEWSDYIYTKKWDWRDFTATLIGDIVVVLLILGLHYGKG